MQEKWQILINYPNYSISSFGRIKNKTKILKPFFSFGYKRIRLYCNKEYKYYSIHRLVAEYFIPNPENKPEVNHIDGNSLNNTDNNLEWVTRSENQKHAFKIGLNRSALKNGKKTRFKKGYLPYNKRINPKTIIDLYHKGYSINQIAYKMNCCIGSVYKYLKKENICLKK